MAKITLATWIKRALADNDKGGKCTQFSLVHMVNGGTVKGKELHTTKLGNGRAWSEAELAELLQGVADSFSQELPGQQTFQVMAFYEGNAQPQAFFHITSQQAGEDENVSFAPTPQGRAAQAMSQESKVFAQMFNKQSQLDNVAMGMIQFLGQDNMQMRQENNEIRGMFFEMIRTKVMDSQAHDVRLAEFQRDTDLRNNLLKMAPALVNSATGREVFPQATEDTALIEALADNIPIENIQLLMGMVDPKLAGVLMTRLEKHAKAKREAREVAEHAARLLSKNDPIEDAVGIPTKKLKGE